MVSIASILFSSAIRSNFINIMFIISICFEPMLSIPPYDIRKKGEKNGLPH